MDTEHANTYLSNAVTAVDTRVFIVSTDAEPFSRVALKSNESKSSKALFNNEIHGM